MKEKKEKQEKLIEVEVEKIKSASCLVREVEMDQGRFGELINSIKNVGLIEPIVVRAVGKGYEIIAGQRRLNATRAIGLPSIMCRVIEADDEQVMKTRWAENEMRRDVSDYERMIFVREIIVKTGKSQKEVGKMVGMSEGYVSQMMGVLAGFGSVLKALKEGRIGFAIARELNRAPSENIADELLVYSQNGNASAGLVREWVTSAVNRSKSEVAADDAEVEAMNVVAWSSEFICESCEQKAEKSSMVIMRLCRSCAQAAVDANRKMK